MKNFTTTVFLIQLYPQPASQEEPLKATSMEEMTRYAFLVSKQVMDELKTPIAIKINFTSIIPVRLPKRPLMRLS